MPTECRAYFFFFGFFFVYAHATDLWVVDPALFNRPVADSEWKSVQGDNEAIFVQTDASVYLLYETPPP